MNKQRLVVALTAALLVLMGVFIHNSFANSYQTIMIPRHSLFTVALYRASTASDSEETPSYDKKSKQFSTQGPGKYKIKRGDYVYVVTGPNSDYRDFANRLRVGGDPVYLTIPTLKLTDSKLSLSLPLEEPSIKAAITGKYSSQMQTYSVQRAKLYEDGRWAGAILTPNDTTTYDTLRVVLHKSASGWVVITDPPEIVLSSPVYPQIPPEVLSDVDNFL